VQSEIVRGCRFLEENGDCRINFPYTNSEFALAAKTNTRRGWGTQTLYLKEKCFKYYCATTRQNDLQTTELVANPIDPARKQ
jgi:hypothetical protein